MDTLGLYYPLGVTERVLEPIWAKAPLNMSPICEHLGAVYPLQGSKNCKCSFYCSDSVLKAHF